MFPSDFELFTEIDDSGIITIGEEMEEIVTAISKLSIQIDESFIKYMYGKMTVHDDIMEIYDSEGNIIRVFDLYDIDGNPTTMAPVFTREIKQ